MRPLYGEESTSASELTRDYVLELDGDINEPALLSIFGGKITTYRKLAEKVLAKLDGHLPANTGASWTGNTPLPGGDFKIGEFDALVEKLMQTCPALDQKQATRLISAYGTRSFKIFAPDGKPLNPGIDFGGGLTQIEVEHLIEHEWATTPDDILWRRSKLGLRLSEQQKDVLENWLREVQEIKRP